MGQVALAVDGQPFRLATPRKSLQVLAYLLMHRAAPVSRDYLAFLLWPDEHESSARARLRATISDLLRVLPQPGTDFVGTNTDAIWWNGDVDLWLDVDAFTDASTDSNRLDEAVALYRGDLLPEIYDEWLYGFRERFRNVYLAVLTQLVSETRKRGDFARAIDFARRILEADPWREDVVRRIVALRYELGDAAGAISEYRQFAARLREEMDVDPMPETVAIVERIRRGDAVPRDEQAASGGRPIERRRALPFLGRERELERLSESWSRATMQRGSVVFIGGEPGIGKSRLVREFMDIVEDRGGRALYGATGYPEAFPYQSIVEALRGQLPLVTALDLGPTWFSALAGVVPEIAQRVGTLPPLPAIEADDQRLRLFEALGRAFVGLARPRPLLVVLEDVHWASQGTFDALSFLARRTVNVKVLFLITFRDSEAFARHPLRQLQRDSRIEGLAASMSVMPLDAGTVGRIVQESKIAFEGALPEFSTALHRRSNGNPLFLGQLLESPSPQASMPTTVAALVGAQIATFSAETRTVAEVAALAGQRFSADVVRDVTGYGDAAVDRALDELLDRRIVQETAGRGILPYAFGHQLVQDAIARLIEPGRLRDRSRRLARALKQLYPEREREFASQIARHLEAAERRDEAASEYLLAGKYALELGAPDDARFNVDRGLALASEPTMIAALLQERQRIDERANNASEESADLDRLVAIGDELDDEDLRCTVLAQRARLAFRAYSGRPAAFAPIAELRERAKRRGSLRWQAEADLIESTFHPLGVDAEKTVALAQRALEAYQRLGDDLGVAGSYAELARTLFITGGIDEGHHAAEEALAIAERLGDYKIAERALVAATSNAQSIGDRDAAVEWNARWLDLTVKAGDRRCEADALGQSTWALLWSPAFLEALPILERAAQICRECGLGPALAVNEMNASEFALKLGLFEPAIAIFERAAAEYEREAPFFAASARANLVLPLAYSGRAQRAVELGRELLVAANETGSIFVREQRAHNLGEAEYAAGALREAIEHLEQAASICESAAPGFAAAQHRALLAAFHAEAGDCSAALAHAGCVPAGEPERSIGVLWPQRTAWCAAFAYRTCKREAQADAWLDRAIALYEEHLPYLNEEQRATFASLPWHRAMLSARAGDWPATAWRL
ncbi:MAG TPA: AAA family ATPase [Candidatus Cybelea sp.]|nr:AAA family ATPase [Candidatus Cybelea sp.]